ncbi:MAG: 50S ribosomal protein L19e [Candidatus Bathyarchaeia archaeon]
MSLKNQRRLAAELLKVGENRVWIDPTRVGDVEVAITRKDIRRLIHEGVIESRPEIGISRVRARVKHKRKKVGRGRGPGSRKGSKGARTPPKELWINRVRALRRQLKGLRDRRVITPRVYRQLYRMIKGGAFKSVAHLEQYIEAHKLARWR